MRHCCQRRERRAQKAPVSAKVMPPNGPGLSAMSQRLREPEPDPTVAKAGASFRLGCGLPPVSHHHHGLPQNVMGASSLRSQRLSYQTIGIDFWEHHGAALDSAVSASSLAVLPVLAPVFTCMLFIDSARFFAAANAARGFQSLAANGCNLVFVEFDARSLRHRREQGDHCKHEYKRQCFLHERLHRLAERPPRSAFGYWALCGTVVDKSSFAAP